MGVTAALAALLVGCGNPSTSPTAHQSNEGPAQTAQSSWWHPEVGDTWQVQLSGGLDLSADADIYVVDGVDAPQSDLDKARANGANTVCYLNGGAWEDWRDDADDFPDAVIGKDLDGWPNEKWLDIRDLETLLPLMAQRMDACRDRGFVAVDVDNVDGYDNDTGFPLNDKDQLAYISALVDLAHDRDLAFGLKNSVGLVGALAGQVDFAVNEQCHEFNECSAYDSFLAAGKPVVVIEYTGNREEICRDVPSGMHILFKDLDLGAELEGCSGN